MNPVEIEEAVSDLAAAPFDAGEFPFAFLTAFGNRQVTVQRLRAGSGNASDVDRGVLQRSNIHMAVCEEGCVSETLSALQSSPKTAANKVKFILATDGIVLEAEELGSGETLACEYSRFADHFGFFLPLAGISAIKQIKDNPVDIKATGRLNKLYIELLKDNPDWATAERRPDLNHLMARLIFCMFAEDTGIFHDRQFSMTVEQMSDSQSVNTHEVIAELFRAMATPANVRAAVNIRSWANHFPFVNGGLFSDAGDCPRFSRIARTYLLRAASLNWQEINPDIFGSMIQAVADDDERGNLGMHYTSVPNILKVLNPLFLDDLRAQLEAAGDSMRKLMALRRRIAAIRVFDPACGSGNFLVIAYKEMREIEHQIVKRTNAQPKSWIGLDNFYGIEIKSFAAEIARLALLIAEFQCDVRMISQQMARSMMLPLHKTGHIQVGNALRMNWVQFCLPATKKLVVDHDLGGPTGRLALEDNNLSEVIEVETYICGNPPYKGSQDQTNSQKADLEIAFNGRLKSSRSADYVSGWFMRARDYAISTRCKFAFVTTNSVNQGRQVALYWPVILGADLEIFFAVPSFPWSNLAARKAVVTVSIIGIARTDKSKKRIYESGVVKLCDYIGAYLVPDHNVIVEPRSRPLSTLSEMEFGSMPNDGGALLLKPSMAAELLSSCPEAAPYIRKFLGTNDAIHGEHRYCLWIEDNQAERASRIGFIRDRIDQVRAHRSASDRETTKKLALAAHSFAERRHSEQPTMLVARHSAENRPYLPFLAVDGDVIVADSAIALPDFKMHEVALYASRLHLVWIATVCGKIKTDYRYSNTLGWNTFPVPQLTAKNKVDLSRCAEDILLARESHFPATIAELYEPDAVPDDLSHAHERNDETLERIYIGRKFRNDTERLEKLFDLYTKMIAESQNPKGAV